MRSKENLSLGVGNIPSGLRGQQLTYSLSEAGEARKFRNCWAGKAGSGRFLHILT